MLDNINNKKKGLARLFQLQCSSCPYNQDFFSSREVDQPVKENEMQKGGGKHMEVNVRAVYGMRAIGAGHSQLEKVCSYLNMPEPMNILAYKKLSDHLKEAVQNVAEQSMAEVSKDLRGDDEEKDVAVSIDGTWQRKGFTSTLGVVTAISVEEGKVLDCVILSKSCKGCTRMESIRKSDPLQFKRWQTSHKCNLNYHGSSPNMEKVGAIKIYERSVSKHKLYYTSFYGDGDSKSYSAVKEFYGPKKPVNKFECIGHYQKRIGCRLRKLRKEKKLGGKNRLTTAKIDTLQNYFGIALRQNVGNLESMKKGCMASLYHVSSYHDMCP